MLRSTTILTLVTLAGLVAGFAREWLLVANWGAGGATDAFLVAMFLPEAVRTTLAGGLLSAAGLPLWREIPDASRMGWLAGQVRHWLLVGCGVAVLLILASTWVVQLIGPGLSVSDSQQSGQALFWLALTIPGVVLQAILTIPLQARGHFLLPGLSSLLFNLPAVGYLWFAGTHATSSTLAQFFILGSGHACQGLAKSRGTSTHGF